MPTMMTHLHVIAGAPACPAWCDNEHEHDTADDWAHLGPEREITLSLPEPYEPADTTRPRLPRHVAVFPSWASEDTEGPGVQVRCVDAYWPLLTPGEARKIAAELMNAADQAEDSPAR